MSNKEIFSSTETAYDLGYKRGKEERFILSTMILMI